MICEQLYKYGNDKQLSPEEMTKFVREKLAMISAETGRSLIKPEEGRCLVQDILYLYQRQRFCLSQSRRLPLLSGGE